MTTVCEMVTLADGGRLHISQGADTAAVLLLGHGAGGGIDVPRCRRAPAPVTRGCHRV